VVVVAGLCALLPDRASNAQSTSPVVSAPAGILPTTQPLDLASRIDAKNASQFERDEAASRLAGLNTTDAKQALLAVLQKGSHDAQLAVARSQMGVPHPDKAFIAPLGALLGGDRNLAEAASRSLARLGSFPEARSLLLNFARDTRQPAALRAVTIRACSAIVDKSVADAMVGLLSDENATLQNAASDALTELTGQNDIGRDPAGWKRWYDANKAKADDAWKLMVYTQRDQRLDEIAQRHTRILGTLDQVLNREFQSAAAADRGPMVLRDMNAVDPEVRAIGANLVQYAFLNNLIALTDAQRQRLTELVGDSDAHVRLEAARTLKAINFAGAFDAMLAQLSIETDPDVKAALTAAIAQIGNVQAVPLLRRLLTDPSITVQRAAVDALRSLGAAYYIGDRDGAHALALELWSLYEQRSKEPGTADLQTACIEALAPLHEESKSVPLVRLLDPEQTEQMRAAALHALRELGNPNTEDGIRNWLPSETVPSVRVEALKALGKTGSFGADAETLYSFFKPGTGEQDASVREWAWTEFCALLPTASKETLTNWATQLSKEPVHRLAVLTELDRQLAVDKDLENLAVQQENTGATYVELDPPRYDQAAKYFQSALDYWQSQNQNNQQTELLVTQLMTALLKSQQYAQAARFAEKMITSSRSQQQTMGALIVQEVEGLQQDTKNPAASAANALKLIDEATKMKPALDSSYLDQLRGYQKQLQQKAPGQ
jgi:HEAT repeat protein